MAREVILDTGIIIESEKKGLELESIVGDDDPAVAAMTAMELLVGVDAWKPGLRDERAVLIEGILASLVIEEYTLKVARMHALLHNHVRRIGRPRGAFDLIIAATAAATGRTLITADKAAAFEDLPGVKAEIVTIR